MDINLPHRMDNLAVLDQTREAHGDKYQREWQAYRRRRNRLAVYIAAEFLAFLPFVALVATVERRLFSTGNLAMPAAICWAGLYLFTGSRLRNFPCPRCGRNFFGGFFATPGNVMGRKCANCGLRKFAGG